MHACLGCVREGFAVPRDQAAQYAFSYAEMIAAVLHDVIEDANLSIVYLTSPGV
jgi:hypothetical protein